MALAISAQQVINMWVLFLEAGVALALFITIIWATLPRKKPDQPAPPGAAQTPPAQGAASEADDESR